MVKGALAGGHYQVNRVSSLSGPFCFTYPEWASRQARDRWGRYYQAGQRLDTLIAGTEHL